MLKELDHVTLYQLLDQNGLVINKPKPDEALVSSTIDNLPVVNHNGLKLIGCGDWTKGRSSDGSVILAGKGYVLKVPLGEQTYDTTPLDRARKLADIACNFKGVAPLTGFFIARVDGQDKPAKVVIYQKENLGKPACDTPLSKLLSPEITRQFCTIIDRMIEVLQKDNLYDAAGIHLDNSNVIKRFIIRFICGIPWISDNIMVDENNNVELVDNVPDLETHEITNSVKKLIISLRLIFSQKLLKLSSQVFSYITRP